MKLSVESVAFHILHLHSQFKDFSFLMVDLGLCFLHVRKWLFVFTLFSLSREWTDSKAKLDYTYFIMTKNIVSFRAWVSTGAAGAWHPPKFWTSPLAPADFEVPNTNWHPQSSFYVISGTLSFKFLTQALSLYNLALPVPSSLNKMKYIHLNLKK
jgi:hypothetical protein